MAQVMRGPRTRPRPRTTKSAVLLWHVGVFVVVNLVLWIVDLVNGGGVGLAPWISIPWSFVLASHVMAYSLDRGDVTDRDAQNALADERRREGEIR